MLASLGHGMCRKATFYQQAILAIASLVANYQAGSDRNTLTSLLLRTYPFTTQFGNNLPLILVYLM